MKIGEKPFIILLDTKGGLQHREKTRSRRRKSRSPIVPVGEPWLNMMETVFSLSSPTGPSWAFSSSELTSAKIKIRFLFLIGPRGPLATQLGNCPCWLAQPSTSNSLIPSTKRKQLLDIWTWAGWWWNFGLAYYEIQKFHMCVYEGANGASLSRILLVEGENS